MADIAFTKNHTDHSNQQGYQFEFHCDKCGNGFRSSYQASTLGMASGFLRAAGDMFGGVLGSAANAGDHLKDALRGKSWDSAFAAAQGAQGQVFAKAARDASLVAGVDFSKPQVAACPHCNAALSGPTKFCGECGKPIAAGPTPCAKCRTPVPAASKFCPECGAPKG